MEVDSIVVFFFTLNEVCSNIWVPKNCGLTKIWTEEKFTSKQKVDFEVNLMVNLYIPSNENDTGMLFHVIIFQFETSWVRRNNIELCT